MDDVLDGRRQGGRNGCPEFADSVILVAVQDVANRASIIQRARDRNTKSGHEIAQIEVASKSRTRREIGSTLTAEDHSGCPAAGACAPQDQISHAADE